MRLLILPLILLAACATTQSLPVEDRSRTYDLDYDQVFDAVVMTLVNEGFSVIDAEKDEGIVNTDYRSEGRWLTLLTGATRMKVSALITEANSRTRVVLNFSLEDATDDLAPGTFQSRNVTGKRARRIYNDMFADIAEQLAG